MDANCDRCLSSSGAKISIKAGFHMIVDRRSKIAKRSAIVCDHLRSPAIVRSYGNLSFVIRDRNASHNIFNSLP